MTKIESSQGTAVVPFLLGGMVGAAVTALLFSRNPSNGLRKQIQDAATSTWNKVAALVNKSVDLYDQTKIAFTSAIEAGKQAYLQEREKFQISD